MKFQNVLYDIYDIYKILEVPEYCCGSVYVFTDTPVFLTSFISPCTIHMR